MNLEGPTNAGYLPGHSLLEIDPSEMVNLLAFGNHRRAPSHPLRNSLIGVMVAAGVLGYVASHNNQALKGETLPVSSDLSFLQKQSDSLKVQIGEPTPSPVSTPRIPQATEFSKTNPSLEMVFKRRNFTSWIESERNAGRVMNITWFEEPLLFQARSSNTPFWLPQYNGKQYSTFSDEILVPEIPQNGVVKTSIVIEHGLKRSVVTFLDGKSIYLPKSNVLTVRPIFFLANDEKGILMDLVNIPAPQGTLIYSH